MMSGSNCPEYDRKIEGAERYSVSSMPDKLVYPKGEESFGRLIVLGLGQGEIFDGR